LLPEAASTSSSGICRCRIAADQHHRAFHRPLPPARSNSPSRVDTKFSADTVPATARSGHRWARRSASRAPAWPLTPQRFRPACSRHCSPDTGRPTWAIARRTRYSCRRILPWTCLSSVGFKEAGHR
jgi:hypothetical protein